MKRISLYYVLVLLCAVVQGAWAQAPTPSTELEPYFTMSNRMIYKFNYPSTSVTGEPVVLSSLLCCWAPATPPEDAAIESVHLYSHYTVSANSQCPTSATTKTADFVVLSILFEGGDYDEQTPFRSVVKRSIAIMPDYEGYGVSSDRTHPYLAEDVTAQQVVDALTYGLELYAKLDGADNTLPLKDDWRCFNIGYSQGGAVALAVQRYIEQNNLSDQLHFRGTFCGDGPYDLIATMRYYLDDDGTSYGVTTDHREDQVTLPAVLPMIMNGMIVSNPTMSNYKLSDYFAQSKGDTVVPYGNYLAFRDAHPDGENDIYRIDETFSDSDHLKSGSTFMTKLAIDFIDYFEWIDAAQPTGIKTMSDVRSMMSDVWYDLNGRKLTGRPTKKGIYIHNGKKVVIAS